jgi:flagellar hook-length control protein FliK
LASPAITKSLLPERKEQGDKEVRAGAIFQLDGTIKEPSLLATEQSEEKHGPFIPFSFLLNRERSAGEKHEVSHTLSHLFVTGEQQTRGGIVEGAQAATFSIRNTGHQIPGQETWRAVIDQVAGGISLGLRSNNEEAHLQLDPPDLGKLDIRLLLDGDRVQAQIIAESADVKALIQAHLPELRDALQSQRLDLDRVQVDVQSGGGEQRDFSHGFRQNSTPPRQERGVVLSQGAEPEREELIEGSSLRRSAGVNVWA